MPPPNRPHVALRVWLWVVFAMYLAACLHEAFGPFLVGHDGFNGAAFSQAARNSLRFGIIQQVQYYTDFDSPPLSMVYTNHPMLLHLHLVGLFAVAGIAPWIARLIPIFYALGFFILLYRVVARRAGPTHAIVAVTIWALTPLHTIFANMVNHEQGGLFWCLLLLDRYLQYHESMRTPGATRAPRWPIFVAVSCAMQFDWVGYYIAFFIGVHALVSALRHRDGGSILKRLGFTVAFSSVVLVNAGIFFGWIIWLRGGLAAMGASFSERAARPSGYLKLLGERSLDLYGAGLLTLLAAWLLVSGLRFLRGRGRPPDFIPWAFAFAQVIHSSVFQSAGAIHSYWTIYAGPALAIGGGALLVDAATRGVRLAAARGRHRQGVTAVVMLAALAVGAQGVFAARQHAWGHENHRASYLVSVSDEWLETQWAILLHARYGREGTCYFVHPSAERTVHVMFHLDAPMRDGYRLLASANFEPPAGPECERRIGLIDNERMALHDAERLRNLVRAHPSLVVERRLIAVELHRSSPPGDTMADLEALLMQPRPAPWWWTWVVSTRNPPLSWEPDPDETWLASGALGPEGLSTSDAWAGGTGGEHTELRCPPGAVVSGLEVHVIDTAVSGLGVACAFEEGALEGTPPGADASVEGAVAGTPSPFRPARIGCAGGAAMTGLRGRAGVLVDAVGPLCHVLDGAVVWTRRPGAPSVRPARIEGGPGGTSFHLPCPPGQRLVGVAVRAAARIDAVSPLCGALPTSRSH